MLSIVSDYHHQPRLMKYNDMVLSDHDYNGDLTFASTHEGTYWISQTMFLVAVLVHNIDRQQILPWSMVRIGSLSILTNKSQVTCSGSWLWCWKYVQQPSQPLDPLVMVLTKCSLIAGPIMAIINHWLTGTHNIILAAANCLSQSWLGCSAQVRNFYNMQNTQSEIFFQPTKIWCSWHGHKLSIWWI